MSKATQKAGKKKPSNLLHLWLRVGDTGDYEDYGQDDFALANAIFEQHIKSDDIDWLVCPRNPEAYAKRNKLHYLPPAGFRTPLNDGDNYISLYWGDGEGNVKQPLTPEEQASLVGRLRKLENPEPPFRPRVERVGDYVVTLRYDCVDIARVPKKGDPKDAKARKNGDGNIPVDEVKGKTPASFSRAVNKAKGFAAASDPGIDPERSKLAKELADLTNEKHGTEVCKPALFMGWSVREIKSQIAKHKGDK